MPLKKTRGWNNTTLASDAVTEAWFLSNGFSSSVDSILSHLLVLGPKRDKAPVRKAKFASFVLLHSQYGYCLTGCYVVVFRRFSGEVSNLKLFLQFFLGCGKRVSSAHCTIPLDFDLSCGKRIFLGKRMYMPCFSRAHMR